MPPTDKQEQSGPPSGPCYLCGTFTTGTITEYSGAKSFRCDNHPAPRQVPPHTPGFRCGPHVDLLTTREELIAKGIKPDAADELLAFRDKLMACTRSIPEGAPHGK